MQPTMHRLPKTLLELYTGLVVILYDRTVQQCEAIRLGEILCTMIRLSLAGFNSESGPFLIRASYASSPSDKSGSFR
ncbi:MAG: hypothetical protein NVS3B14_08170 [Ktedonobacteraceae bacterium]